MSFVIIDEDEARKIADLLAKHHASISAALNEAIDLARDHRHAMDAEVNIWIR